MKSDFAVELAQARAKEKVYRVTMIGPHRDEVQISLNAKVAAHFGSEGQKRTVAIALKMAQAEYLLRLHGTSPILLIDDIMGELDLKRRNGFLPLLEQARQGQVFMTATEENWARDFAGETHRWQVKEGSLKAITE